MTASDSKQSQSSKPSKPSKPNKPRGIERVRAFMHPDLKVQQQGTRWRGQAPIWSTHEWPTRSSSFPSLGQSPIFSQLSRKALVCPECRPPPALRLFLPVWGVGAPAVHLPAPVPICASSYLLSLPALPAATETGLRWSLSISLPPVPVCSTRVWWCSAGLQFVHLLASRGHATTRQFCAGHALA